MLKLDDISKVYAVGAFGRKQLHAVRHVSFTVGDGEIVALIGESGSGKSTIGKLILGLTPISGGRIEFNGADITTLRGAARKAYYQRVQGVFQDPFSSYNPIFKADRIFATVRAEFFPQLPEGAWQAKLFEALDAVGLDPAHVLHKFPHQLSGGQLQRLLIARALLLDIQFLVADEVISMLDASTRIDVLNLLADLSARGLSILLITHDLSLGYYISERAVILYRGSVVEMGASRRIFDSPLHPYTQMLMASVPRLDRKWEPGSAELKAARPRAAAGCVYADRCPFAEAACFESSPALAEAGPDHLVACFRQPAGAAQLGPPAGENQGYEPVPALPVAASEATAARGAR
jgi:peptide/nickel transport system ATP-binding protein